MFEVYFLIGLLYGCSIHYWKWSIAISTIIVLMFISSCSSSMLLYIFRCSDQWRRKWQPTPVFLPRESHGQRSLVGCCPWGRTEHACIGDGHGKPLQYSSLENPRDRGAWWATVCGVAQSQTRLKRLSSSSRDHLQSSSKGIYWILEKKILCYNQ